MDPLFLSLDEVLKMHQQQIDRYGGSPGIRDSGGLQAALATPQATFGGDFLHPSIPAIANAIHDAVGIQLLQLPMTPERVKKALALRPRSS